MFVLSIFGSVSLLNRSSIHLTSRNVFPEMCVKKFARGVIFFPRVIIVLEVSHFSISAAAQEMKCVARRNCSSSTIVSLEIGVNITTYFRCTAQEWSTFCWNLLLISKLIFISVACWALFGLIHRRLVVCGVFWRIRKNRLKCLPCWGEKPPFFNKYC